MGERRETSLWEDYVFINVLTDDHIYYYGDSLNKLKRSLCQYCQSPVVHAKTGMGKWISVNPKRSDEGSIVFLKGTAIFDHSGHLEGPRFVPHSETCVLPVRPASSLSPHDDDDIPLPPLKPHLEKDTSDVFGPDDDEDDCQFQAEEEACRDTSDHILNSSERQKR